ncbi:MAG TPA: hypothetical protein VLG71_03330 [Candidatus Limnocylindria bacterium]|nr:hypothetical protein [Candidatus Limnocylindria bacterium]
MKTISFTLIALVTIAGQIRAAVYVAPPRDRNQLYKHLGLEGDVAMLGFLCVRREGGALEQAKGRAALENSYKRHDEVLEKIRINNPNLYYHRPFIPVAPTYLESLANLLGKVFWRVIG